MDEDIFVPFIMLTFFLILTWMILNYRKWKLMHKQEMRQSQDNSMSLDELKEMMQEIVEDSTEPLLERIEALEETIRRTETPRLMPAQRDEILEELNQTPVKETEPAERRA